MKPSPENDSPPRSWFYILVGVILIFSLTFVFQEINESSNDNIDPTSFEQVKEQVQELNQKVKQLEQRIEDLES